MNTNSLKHDLANYLSGFVTDRRFQLFEQVLAERTGYLKVMLIDILDPHDVCAVMRSCDCFGIQELHHLSTGKPFKLSLGVAVGSSKWISMNRHHHPGEGQLQTSLQAFRDQGHKLVAVSPAGEGHAIHQLPLDRPMMLCFGDEKRDYLAENPGLFDYRVHLPTVGFGSTFNISVKTALCLSILRNRLADSSRSWRLSDEERELLLLTWLAKMPRRIGSLVQRFLEKTGRTDAELADAGLPVDILRLISDSGLTKGPGSQAQDPG